MKVLVAGATGAIGRPLIRCLKESGHAVFGLVRSSDSESDLVEMGAEAVTVDALDAASVKAAIQRIRPDAIINQLTSLPRHYMPEEMKAAADRDRTDRTKGISICWPRCRPENDWLLIPILDLFTGPAHLDAVGNCVDSHRSI